MGKLYFALYLIAIILCSTLAYHYFQSEWVFFYKGERAFKIRNCPLAISHYLKALENGIDPEKVINQLSICAACEEEYQMIDRIFEQVVCKRKQKEEIIFAISPFYIKTKQTQRGVDFFIRILQKHADNTQMRLAFTRFLSVSGLFKEAITQYEILQTQIPFTLKLQVEYARICSLAKQYDKASNIYLKILKRDPHLYPVQIALANVYLNQHQYSKALQILIQIPSSQLDLSTKILIADLFCLEGNFSQGEKILLHLIKKYPKNTSLLLKYADLLSIEKKYPQAITRYEKILRDHPQDLEVRKKLAFSLIYDKRYKEAEKEFERILDPALKKENRCSILSPKRRISDASVRLAYARLLRKDPTKQRKSLHQYLLLLEENPDDLQVHCELSSLYRSLKMTDEAIREIIWIKSKSPINGCIQEAELYISLEEYDRAIEAIGKLPNAYSSSNKTLLQLAIAYEKLDQTKQALEIYQHLLQRTKKPSASLYEKIGDLYLALKSPTEALPYFKKALDKRKRSSSLKKKMILALRWSGYTKEAFLLLEKYHKKHPKDKEIAIELAHSYSEEKEYVKAEQILLSLQKVYTYDSSIEIELIALALAQGHAEEVKRRYQNLILTTHNDLVLLDYANAMNLWGDFYRSEQIYREYLEKYPTDEDVQLLLAKLLISTERYEEAEQLYKMMIIPSNSLKIHLLLAELEMRLRNDDTARKFIEKCLEQDPQDLPASLLLSKSLIKKKEYVQAKKVLQTIICDPRFQIQGFLELGKLALLENEEKRALFFFQKVLLLDANNSDALFYLFKIQKQPSLSLSAEQSNRWAQLYTEEGKREEAIRHYQASLARDPDYFPSQIGLAQLYGSSQRYKKALDILDTLLKSFPDNYKLLLWKARILGWKKSYDQSIEIYGYLHTLNPKDPIPIKEMARTQTWAKNIQKALKTYDLLLYPSVDQQLLSSLKEISKTESMIFKLPKNKKKPYVFYEELQKKNLPSLQKVLLYHLAQYKIQKSIFLESQAKKSLWGKKFLHADDQLRELVAFDLRNEEALFDLAQVQCTLGLCDESKKFYLQLLDFDPLHSLAKTTYEQNIIRGHPFLSLNHSYWGEQGRGQLDRIYRNHTFLTVAFPIHCRNILSFRGNFWNERPNFSSVDIVLNEAELARSYRAEGFSISYLGRPYRFMMIDANLTQKFYEHNIFTATTTGYGRIFINAYDAFILGGGYDHYDELDNYYTLKQRTQVGEWWGSITSNLNRRGEIEAKFRWLNFSDNNKMQYHDIELAALLSQHPYLLKLSTLFEYRDSKYQNIYVFEGNALSNIIYPYWTPKKYFSGKVRIEWHHDLSKLLICGNLLHFYDFRISTGTDTEENPMVTFEGIWHVDLHKNWSFDIRASIFQSKLWNAQGAWATLQTQF